VISGGVQVTAPAPVGVVQVDGFPASSNTAWTAQMANSGGTASSFVVYAICTAVSTTG
jgi:hypothetical protein